MWGILSAIRLAAESSQPNLANVVCDLVDRRKALGLHMATDGNVVTPTMPYVAGEVRFCSSTGYWSRCVSGHETVLDLALQHQHPLEDSKEMLEMVRKLADTGQIRVDDVVIFDDNKRFTVTMGEFID